MIFPDHIGKFLVLGFYRTEKGYWVECPYVPLARGKVLLNKFTRNAPDGEWEPEEQYSHVASSMVKLSHHSSGESLFSKDKFVYTRVRNMSTPPDIADGLAFLFQAQGVDQFVRRKLKEAMHADGVDRLEYNCPIALGTGQAVRISGYLYPVQRLKEIAARNGMRVLGPHHFPKRVSDEERLKVILLSGPTGTISESLYLLLEIEEINPVSRLPPQHIQLAGGIAHVNDSEGNLLGTSLIAISAPIPSDSLPALGLPSIDFEPDLATTGKRDATR